MIDIDKICKRKIHLLLFDQRVNFVHSLCQGVPVFDIQRDPFFAWFMGSGCIGIIFANINKSFTLPGSNRETLFPVKLYESKLDLLMYEMEKSQTHYLPQSTFHLLH